MKKSIIFIGITLVTSLILVGCGAEKGKDSPQNEEQKVLKIWSIATESDSFYNAYDKAIQDYEKAHPDVKIEAESFENQSYKTKLKSAAAADDLPDIFYTWGGGFSKSFVDSGKVLELDTYYEKYKADLPETVLQYATYDGKLYGSTYTTPVSMLFYNKKMFEDEGIKVPTNWDDFFAAVKSFKAKDITPIGLTVKDTWVLAMLHDNLVLKSVGPEQTAKALTADGAKYTEQDFVDAAEKLVSLKKAGAFSDGATGLSNDEAVATFLNGKVPMYITGSWLGGQINAEATNPSDYDVIPFPVINDNASTNDFMGGAVDTLMVNANSANKEIAGEAVFELSKSISKYAYLDGAGIAAWNRDYDDKDVNELTKKVAAYTSEADSFTIWFDTLMNADAAGEYLSLLQELYAGNIDSQEFAESMSSQLSK